MGLGEGRSQWPFLEDAGTAEQRLWNLLTWHVCVRPMGGLCLRPPAAREPRPRPREIRWGAAPGAGEGLALDSASHAEKSPSLRFWAQVLLHTLTVMATWTRPPPLPGQPESAAPG